MPLKKLTKNKWELSGGQITLKDNHHTFKSEIPVMELF
jgi:hypothetical protein